MKEIKSWTEKEIEEFRRLAQERSSLWKDRVIYIIIPRNSGIDYTTDIGDVMSYSIIIEIAEQLEVCPGNMINWNGCWDPFAEDESERDYFERVIQFSRAMGLGGLRNVVQADRNSELIRVIGSLLAPAHVVIMFDDASVPARQQVDWIITGMQCCESIGNTTAALNAAEDRGMYTRVSYIDRLDNGYACRCWTGGILSYVEEYPGGGLV